MNDVNPISAARRKSLPYLFCSDLAKEKRWSTELCCAECHSDESLLIQEVTTEFNPFEGRRNALICCRAFELMNDWYPDRHYHTLPEHE